MAIQYTHTHLLRRRPVLSSYYALSYCGRRARVASSIYCHRNNVVVWTARVRITPTRIARNNGNNNKLVCLSRVCVCVGQVSHPVAVRRDSVRRRYVIMCARRASRTDGYSSSFSRRSLAGTRSR